MIQRKFFRFENWKGGRVIIKRDIKGRIETWRYQKRSQIKTLNQAVAQYDKTQTFRKDIVRVKSRVKPQNIRVPESTRVQQIGKNTGMIISKNPIKSKDYYQFTAEISWGGVNGVTKGYSDLVAKGGNKNQAFKRAYAEASSLNIVDYEDEPIWVNENTGYIQTGKNTALYFHVEYYVQTYIKTLEV